MDSQYSPQRIPRLILLILACFAAGCSVLLDFEDCETNAECDGGICNDGVCESPTCESHGDCESLGDEFSCINRECFALDESMCTRDAEAGPDDGPILHVGLLLPFTGRNADKAAATAAAAKTAFRQINLAHNGIRGVRLEGLECDTEQAPDRAEAVATYLAEEVGVPAIIGSISSSETLSASDVTIENDVVMISPASTSPAISTLDDDDLVWRTIPSDALQGPALGQIVADGTYDDVVVFSAETTYGQGLFNAFAGSDQVDSGEITSLVYSVDAEGNLEEDSVVEDATELFLDDSFQPGAILILGSLESQQLVFALDDTFFGDLPEEEKPVWILSEAGRDRGLLDAKFSGVWDRIQGTVIEAPDTPAYEAFAIRYESETEFVAAENPFADKAYDAAFLLALGFGVQDDPLGAPASDVAEALAQTAGGETTFAPGDDLGAALNALEEGAIDYEGASGPVDFNDAGDVRADISQWRINTDGEPEFETVGVVLSAE